MTRKLGLLLITFMLAAMPAWSITYSLQVWPSNVPADAAACTLNGLGIYDSTNNKMVVCESSAWNVKDIFSGINDFGDASSLEIPNGTGPTIDGVGEIGIDTTANQFVYYSGAKRVLTYIDWISVTLLTPTSSDDPLVFKAPYDLTITDIDCIVDPAGTGESVSIDVQECNGTGDSCATVDAAITCDNDGATDDGSFTNAPIDSGDWVMIDVGTPTGTVSQVSVTIIYTIDSK